MLAKWLTVFVVTALSVISPGPNFVMVVRTSLTGSRRQGVASAIGVSTGDAVHATYCLLGIGALVASTLWLFETLRWAGALYFLYIGVRALFARPSAEPTPAADPDLGAVASPFRQGILVSLLNPKATLFYLALFTQVVDPFTPLPARVLFGATAVTIAVLWYSTVALVLTQSALQRRFLAFSHWIERATGVVLIALGLRMAIPG